MLKLFRTENELATSYISPLTGNLERLTGAAT